MRATSSVATRCSARGVLARLQRQSLDQNRGRISTVWRSPWRRNVTRTAPPAGALLIKATKLVSLLTGASSTVSTTSPWRSPAVAAGSPSIWWGNGSVLADEPHLTATVTAGHAQPRIFLGVGEEEQKLTRSALRFYGSKEAAESALQFVRMVDNAVELGQRLASLRGSARFEVSTVVFADEDHISVIPALISRAARFTLSSEGTAPAFQPSGESTADLRP